MGDVSFEEAYPVALRVVQVRVRAAVAGGAIPPADREDCEQEALLACWSALPKFNPERSCLKTFLERVVATRVATFIRAAKRAPAQVPLKEAAERCADSKATEMEFRADAHGVIDSLSEVDRQLVVALFTHTPAEAARLLGMPKSTVHDHIVRLRKKFVDAGLAPMRKVTRMPTVRPVTEHILAEAA